MRILTGALLALLAGPACSAATPDFSGDPETGWVYVQRHCVGCHSLKGPRSFRSIAQEPGMTGTALMVWLTSSEHRDMPHLILKPDEAQDVVAYILSQGKDTGK